MGEEKMEETYTNVNAKIQKGMLVEVGPSTFNASHNISGSSTFPGRDNKFPDKVGQVFTWYLKLTCNNIPASVPPLNIFWEEIFEVSKQEHFLKCS